MKYIECSGTPEEMGFQYGSQAKEEILMALEGDAHKNFSTKIKKHASRIDAIEKNLCHYFPEIYQEIIGIAKGCGVSPKKILLLNHVDTFSDAWQEGCTPVGLISEKDGIIIAKNNDGHPYQRAQYPFIIRKSVPDKGLPLLQLTYAGWLSGLDSMNSAGLANTHGSVGSVFDKSGYRVDIRLATYALMRSCETTAELYNKLNELSLTGKGFNIIAGDRENSPLIIEAAVPLIASRRVESNFFYTTNHFLTDALIGADMRSPSGKRISTYRLGYLDWVAEAAPPQNLDEVKKILSSHEPWAPCRHGGPHISETYWSQICIPAQGKMLITDGAPCNHEYKEYVI
jgi:isopenicillin-N N-acyltransferase like protein